MKSFRKLLSFLLALAMIFALTGCGYEIKIDVRDTEMPVISQITYYTEEELKTDIGKMTREDYLSSLESGDLTREDIVEMYKTGLESGTYKDIDLETATVEELLQVISPDKTLEESLKEENPDLVFEKVKKGKEVLYKIENKYTRSEDNPNAHIYIDEKGEEIYMESQIISADTKKAEMFLFDEYITDSSSSSGSLSTTYDFYSLTAKYPFKVYYTNGTKEGKKGASFEGTFAAGEERCVAVANKKTFDITKITVNIETLDFDWDTGEYVVKSSKAFKKSKTYKTGDRLSIGSKNAIKVFTINGQNVVENTYRFNEAGKYKVKIVLANDTTKEFTVKVK